MKLKKKKHQIIFIVITALLCLFVLESIRSNNVLITTEYRLTAPITQPIRILQLSDLHNHEFGENNQRLLSKVAQQEPDLILLTGDMLNSGDRRVDIMLDAVRKLSNIAPVYYSYGNHEIQYELNFYKDLLPLIEEAGAVVLDDSYVDIEINAQTIRLGGVYGYCLPEEIMQHEEINPEVCDFLLDFQDTERYKILMCHMPYGWVTHDALDDWEIDCVFSGHAHGGQIRVPFLGSLYAPDQGWLPGRVWGSFTAKNSEHTLILSRGLGSSVKIPRLNNAPEIVVVDILPEDVIG